MRHTSIALTSLTASLAVCAIGCTSDLRAPSNYLGGDVAADSDTGADMLMVDCGDTPQAAVGAAFTHTVMAAGGDDNYTFELEDGAPQGLAIDPSSGEISGAPVDEGGAVEFNVTVTDGTGATGTAVCSLSVNPRLGVDLQVEAPGCLSGTQTLRDAIVDGTGDGTEIVCAHPGGRGNGRMPDGHSVGDQSCQIEGTFQDIRFGTWVVMMRGSQSGVDVWVPFCITNDDPGDSYDVNVEHSGGENTLVPFIGTFNPDASYALGMPGEPHFTAEDPDSCGTNSCNYGFNYSVTSTNFNDTDLNALVTGDQLLRDDADDPIGMEHDIIRLQGSDIGEEFRERPWVMSLGFDYCIADNTDDCSGAAIQDNAGARFHFSVLMFPDGT